MRKKKIKSIYVIGSLRNPKIASFSNDIEKTLKIEAFDSWACASPIADDAWKKHEKARGRTFEQALNGWAANHVFEFDAKHLRRCDAAVLYMPAGKSGCIELGVMLGWGKPGFIVYDKEPSQRWDVMLKFSSRIFFSRKSFFRYLKKEKYV